MRETPKPVTVKVNRDSEFRAPHPPQYWRPALGAEHAAHVFKPATDTAAVQCGPTRRLECDHHEFRSLRKTPTKTPMTWPDIQTLCRGCHIAKTAAENRGEMMPGRKEWQVLVAELLERTARYLVARYYSTLTARRSFRYVRNLVANHTATKDRTQ